MPTVKPCAALILALMVISGCPGDPPRIAVSDLSHDFGAEDIPWQFEVWNEAEQGQRLQFEVSTDSDAVTVDPSSGTSRGPEDKVSITVTFDRSLLEKADPFAIITLTSNGGEKTVELFAGTSVVLEGEDEEGEIPVREGEDEGEPPGEGEDVLIEIPDAALSVAVHDALGFPHSRPIFASEMAELPAELRLQNLGIADLTGLEYARGVFLLDLENNAVESLAPLAGLDLIAWLNLAGNQVSALTPLAAAVNLETLDLRANAVVSLAPLTGLTSLRRLILPDNLIEDIGPLSGLAELEVVDFSGNLVTDIDALEDLEKLEDVFLEDNLVEDISTLQGLPALVSLNLGGNLIEDLAPLVANAGIGAWDYIYLSGNPLSQHAVCTQIPSLEARDVDVVYFGTCEGEVETAR